MTSQQQIETNSATPVQNASLNDIDKAVGVQAGAGFVQSNRLWGFYETLMTPMHLIEVRYDGCLGEDDIKPNEGVFRRQ